MTKCELSFQMGLLDEGEGKPRIATVTPVMNGIPLTLWIESFEREQGFEASGRYGGLVPDFFKYPPFEQYFLGTCGEDEPWVNLRGIYLLGCECGEVGCWPLIAQITLNRDVVIWDHFKQPYRPKRDYSAFGPFVFDAEQYRSAVAAMEAQLTTRNA